MKLQLCQLSKPGQLVVNKSLLDPQLTKLLLQLVWLPKKGLQKI